MAKSKLIYYTGRKSGDYSEEHFLKLVSMLKVLQQDTKELRDQSYSSARNNRDNDSSDAYSCAGNAYDDCYNAIQNIFDTLKLD